jgi:hypothetical protein
MSRTAIQLAALLFGIGVVGCKSTAQKPMCGGPRDGGVIEVGLEAPPGCPPTANELGIGQPCTMCGNECKLPLRCTCDPYLGVQLEGVPCVCTKVQPAPTGSNDPCLDVGGGNFCGSNTTCCNVQKIAAYCIPSVCLIDGVCIDFNPPDAGPDGDVDGDVDGGVDAATD